jgi:hypothetical protein
LLLKKAETTLEIGVNNVEKVAKQHAANGNKLFFIIMYTENG